MLTRLETKIEALKGYSNDQWQELLEASLYAPHPGRLITVPRRIRPGDRKGGLADRRQLIEQRLSEGVCKGDIARELGVSPGLISKILSGHRR